VTDYILPAASKITPTQSSFNTAVQQASENNPQRFNLYSPTYASGIQMPDAFEELNASKELESSSTPSTSPQKEKYIKTGADKDFEYYMSTSGKLKAKYLGKNFDPTSAQSIGLSDDGYDIVFSKDNTPEWLGKDTIKSKKGNKIFDKFKQIERERVAKERL
jgi:hypothetical protein